MDKQLSKILADLKALKDSGLHSGVFTDVSIDLLDRIKKVTASIEADFDKVPSNKADLNLHLKTSTYEPKEEKKRGPKPKK